MYIILNLILKSKFWCARRGIVSFHTPIGILVPMRSRIVAKNIFLGCYPRHLLSWNLALNYNFPAGLLLSRPTSGLNSNQSECSLFDLKPYREEKKPGGCVIFNLW